MFRRYVFFLGSGLGNFGIFPQKNVGVPLHFNKNSPDPPPLGDYCVAQSEQHSVSLSNSESDSDRVECLVGSTSNSLELNDSDQAAEGQQQVAEEMISESSMS